MAVVRVAPIAVYQLAGKARHEEYRESLTGPPERDCGVLPNTWHVSCTGLHLLVYTTGHLGVIGITLEGG